MLIPKTFNIASEQIYYWNDNSIYVIVTNGKGNKKITSGITDRFQVYEDSIYALNNSNQLLVFNDKGESEILLEVTGENFNIHGGFIYFIMPNKIFHDINPDIFNVATTDPTLQHGTMFRCNLDGSKMIYGNMDNLDSQYYLVVNDECVIAVDTEFSNLHSCMFASFNEKEEFELLLSFSKPNS